MTTYIVRASLRLQFGNNDGVLTARCPQLAILNAGSTLGRVLPVFLAGACGVYTMLLPALASSAALVFALFGAVKTPSVVAVAVLFGVSSGFCTYMSPIVSLAFWRNSRCPRSII